MKQFVITTSILFTGIHLLSQDPNWSEHIAPIFYEHCVKCHREGQLGPFELITYESAFDNADDIVEVVMEREMPPWPADPEYRHFAYEELLTNQEIQLIEEWVDNDTPQGDLELAPEIPIFPTGSQLDIIDFTVQIEPYTLQYDEDEYRWFTIENPYDFTVYVNAIEVIPGLPEFVHHADISYDLTGVSHDFDLEDPLPGFNGNTGGPNYDYYMNAWMAGGNVVRYPENWGIEVLPGSYFVLEIHYGPGGIGETDSTKMHLQFVTNPEDVRPVYASWILNGPDENGGYLSIPPGEITWFTQESGTFTYDRSIIAICPHQHMLGDTYKIWLETEEGDSIPMIDIPHWDFHWQKYYTYIHPEHIPAGSKLKAVASFDNTSDNEDNPHDPPIHVYGGIHTTDEMLMTFIIWSPYEEGDEEILMDSTLIPENISEVMNTHLLQLYPNPAADYVYIRSSTSGNNNVIRIFDCMGNLMKEENANTNIIRNNISDLPSGLYIVELENDLVRNRQKLIRK